ncbi:carbohydrate ABC transporter permease [Clostridium swellfunianum]|uniref:carbohydrate ABC transporter permease n=1 Tax=Clostridium swellfunianum TaxID=1367462 RepID=UPI00202FAF8E|nr:carbohydrate ABC transporter permease [Clostridium swellfunianum]MCM0649871.1 carbohydrate ABC transporter permease [Clostridium swellfunianum]
MVKNKSTKIKMSLGEKIFTVFNYLLFILIGIITLFPFLNIIAKSFSSEAAVISGKVSIIPVEFQLGTYKYVLANSQFINSFKVSVFITVAGTLLSLVMTVVAAYPLSKPRLRGRKIFTLIYIFTMLFSGGLVPTYILMSNLRLVNKLPILILPSLISVYNLLIIKSYFESIPDSLEESAKLDGASNTTILFKIILPLSLPVFATIALFYAVGYWNNYFTAMIYITNPSLKPMQLYLKEMLYAASDVFLQINNKNIDATMNSTPEAIQAASIITATVPIVIVYPFLQKYFVKGVLIGSVKE